MLRRVVQPRKTGSALTDALVERPGAVGREAAACGRRRVGPRAGVRGTRGPAAAAAAAAGDSGRGGACVSPPLRFFSALSFPREFVQRLQDKQGCSVTCFWRTGTLHRPQGLVQRSRPFSRPGSSDGSPRCAARLPAAPGHLCSGSVMAVAAADLPSPNLGGRVHLITGAPKSMVGGVAQAPRGLHSRPDHSASPAPADAPPLHSHSATKV